MDWIGISTYNYERQPNGELIPPTNDALTSPDKPGSLYRTNYDFYNRMVVPHSKPFIISETGSPLESNHPGNRTVFRRDFTSEEEVALKQGWWRSIFANAFPGGSLSRLAGFVWFEISKPEEVYVQNTTTFVNRNFKITTNQNVIDAFRADYDQLYDRMAHPGSFKASCDGSIYKY